MSNKEAGIAHILLIGGMVLFTGSGGVVIASDGSKPGDLLYSIDRGTENIRLPFAVTDGMKESMHRSLAQERLQELQALFAEKEVDAKGITVALSNFSEHKAVLASLIDGDDPEHAKEVDDEFEGYESEIDALFESRQESMEQEREQLKKQYEEAMKSGDTALAATLKRQIDAYESLLDNLEAEREAAKQKLEEHEKEIEEHEDEDVRHQEETEREAAKKRAEAAREAAKQAAEDEHEDEDESEDDDGESEHEDEDESEDDDDSNDDNENRR